MQPHRPFISYSGFSMESARTVFISDIHLGCRHANAAALLDFLNGIQPESLYLVGDIVDGWRLRRGWYWNDTYNLLLRRLIELMASGTQIYYTPGNHDEFLRQFISNLGSIEIADEFVHETADGRRMLVMHGDQFDAVVRHARWLSMVGDVGYSVLLGVNTAFNVLRRQFGWGYWSLSAYIKRHVKQATSCIGRFEASITRYAASKGCDGVICGHIHTAAIRELGGVTYCNTGDWVESCTALVEHVDGRLELIGRPPQHGTVRNRPRKHPHAATAALRHEPPALVPN